jgi:hypothetical protein
LSFFGILVQALGTDTIGIFLVQNQKFSLVDIYFFAPAVIVAIAGKIFTAGRAFF